MNDDELMELFSAFDDVSASESLQSSTLDFIMSAGAVAAEPVATEEKAEQAPEIVATHGGKARRRNRWRAMRTAAVAACLALALTGGAAYAYPASTVLVTQGETTIELHVNMFGQVLSASASDYETQNVIDQMGLVHTQYADSVVRVSDSLKESNPEIPVEVVVDGVAQAVESHEELPTPQAEITEPDDKPLTAGESVAIEDDVAVTVVNTPVVTTPVVSAVANAEAPIRLPSNIDEEEKEDSPSDSGTEKRAPSREAPQPSQEKPDTADTPVDDDSSSADDGTEDEIIEPVQPVIVDDGDSAADATPVESDDVDSDSQETSESSSSTVRSPHYFGDDDD